MGITDIISIVLSIIGVLIALAIYFKQKKDSMVKYFARQIQMYYDEEQFLIKEICDLRKKLKVNPDNPKTVKTEFRSKVETVKKIRETSSTVKKFI